MVGSRVYVGGLPYGVRERDLERFFKGYGRTRDILIKNGYGFVEFEDYRDADDAVYELNGKELLGERVVVEPARGQARGSHRDRYNDSDRYSSRRGGGRYNNDKSSSRYGPPLRTEYRLIVENLSSRVSWQDLKDYMRQAGEVTYADAHKQRRNEGVVEFASLSDMKTAIEKLDDTELNGRRIRLVEDRRGGRSGRGRSRSSSRSSRSRSRSRSRRRRSSSRSRSPRSRSKSRGGRSKSKSPKSRSRSKSNNRDLSKSKSKSRSHSRDSRSRSRSKSHKRGDSRDSRDRSLSKGSKDRHHSRSSSPKNNGGSGGSPDRNESMDD
ncbi:serine-arginine protein 55 isoform X2 [Sitodiplosis mosellana]|uniref:serine-arginine protein 55 isoform X2 n=1 Tax=Sitodiplosis mosellana TaxID=263140 RepID=UPI002444B980|nr:serine-arginine protein 55 isoform X2 [Sitodiplosis mosellana]